MVRITLRSYDHKILDINCKGLVEDLLAGGFKLRGPIFLPVKVKRWTLLSSPHVNKNAREQLEIRFSKRLIDVLNDGENGRSIVEVLGKRSFDQSINLTVS